MTQRHPRVLVLSADELTADFSTGITVVNLLREWPADRLAQVCAVASSGGGEGLTPRTVVLPANGGVADVPVRWALRQGRRARTVRARRGQTVPAASTAAAASTDPSRPHASLAALLELGPTRVSGPVRDLLRDFDPEVIYAPVSGIRMMRLARRLSRITGAPVVPHFLDDWPTTLYESGEVGGLARRALLAELEGTLRDAGAVGVISRAMGEEYEHRYGTRAIALMNCVETLDSPSSGPVPGTTTFAYVGGLHLGRAALLLEVARAVEATPGAELVVHAPTADLERHGQAFGELSSVRWGPSLDADDVHAALARADVLVHLESFDPSTARYTRLSISTKIPQYLGAARPVLAVGPGDLASMRHLADSGAAVLVHDVNGATLGQAVGHLTRDPEARANLGARAVTFASHHHHGPLVRERLRTLLREVST